MIIPLRRLRTQGERDRLAAADRDDGGVRGVPLQRNPAWTHSTGRIGYLRGSWVLFRDSRRAPSVSIP